MVFERPPLGRPGADGLHRAPADLVARRTRSWSSLSPGPSCSNGARDGGPPAQRADHHPRAAARRTMRELLHGLVPGLPARPPPLPSSSAPRASRCTRSRPSGCCSTPGGCAEGDGYALTAELTDLQVPDTLRALVAARLDANDPADRALLTDAAVLGQSFTLAGLVGMTGRDAADLEQSLDRLVRRELLLRDDDPRSPERGQYRFLQAVVREVAYDSLAKKDRRGEAPRGGPSPGVPGRRRDSPGSWPSTTSRPIAPRRPAPRPMRWPRRRGSRSAARPSGLPRSTRTPAPCTTWKKRSR